MNYEEKYKQALERAIKIHSKERITGIELVTCEEIFPELRESEDERIRKELISFITDRKNWFPKEETKAFWIAWLEKQGEHANFRNKIQVGDEVTKNEDGVLVNLSQLNRMAKPSEKSANKNKPKFKVGDWITNGEYTWKVTDIKPLDYILQSQNGDVVDDAIFYVDEEFHLWTIEDAKDGDVLAEHETIVLFKKIEGQNIKCYCTYHYLSFNPIFNVDTLQNKNPYYPATKEQCDTLFQKMREAGYEWDDEKKEVKKIEQKPTWNEEDEKMLSKLIEVLNGGMTITPTKTYIDWLKSLKDRIQPQPKQEWSEEDKDNLNCVIATMEEDAQLPSDTVKRLCKWLKSLKSQNRWRPSGKQMSVLQIAIKDYGICAEKNVLESLYNDLKNL